jgi:hypothetical protein
MNISEYTRSRPFFLPLLSLASPPCAVMRTAFATNCSCHRRTPDHLGRARPAPPGWRLPGRARPRPAPTRSALASASPVTPDLGPPSALAGASPAALDPGPPRPCLTRPAPASTSPVGPGPPDPAPQLGSLC